MTKLKTASLLFILMLRLTVFAQPGTEILIEKRYVLALIHDVERLHACDSLVSGLQKSIENADSLIQNQGVRIELLTQQRDVSQNSVNTWAVRYDLQKDEAKYRLKQSRLKTLKITLVAIGEAVVIVLLIL